MQVVHFDLIAHTHKARFKSYLISLLEQQGIRVLAASLGISEEICGLEEFSVVIEHMCRH
jgi:hypothetical protein